MPSRNDRPACPRTSPRNSSAHGTKLLGVGEFMGQTAIVSFSMPLAGRGPLLRPFGAGAEKQPNRGSPHFGGPIHFHGCLENGNKRLKNNYVCKKPSQHVHCQHKTNNICVEKNIESAWTARQSGRLGKDGASTSRLWVHHNLSIR